MIMALSCYAVSILSYKQFPLMHIFSSDANSRFWGKRFTLIANLDFGAKVSSNAESFL
jgi:hypothetical protein